jgi:hypothetical protein
MIEGSEVGRAARAARARRSTLVGALLVGLAATGCAAPFDGRTYHGEGFTFAIAEPPASWRRIEVGHASLAFEDATSGVDVLVNGRCDRDGEDVPLRSLVQHLFIQFTDRSPIDERIEPFDGREAMRASLTAKLDGVPRRFVAWVLKKDGCVYDVLLVAPPDASEGTIGAFDAWTRSFRVEPREGVR